MARMTSLEYELSQMCFEAERGAGQAMRDGDMEKYKFLRGQYEAYKTSAQMVESYFENPWNR